MPAAKKTPSPAPRKKKPTRKAVEASKGICFIIMPMGGWFDFYYEDVFYPAIAAAGLQPRRADDLYRPSAIVHDIWEYTNKARLVLADLTGKNPNVFYELGLAHAIGKPAILLAESMDDVPFDLRSLRVIVYDKNSPDWGAQLAKSIRVAIEEVLEAPQDAVLPSFLKVKGRPEVAVFPQEKELRELRQDVDYLKHRVCGPGAPSRRYAEQERSSQLYRLPTAASSVRDVLSACVRRTLPLRELAEEVMRRYPISRSGVDSVVREMRGLGMVDWDEPRDELGDDTLVRLH